MQTEPTIHFNQRLDTEVQNLKTNECENGWEDQVEFQEIRSNDTSPKKLVVPKDNKPMLKRLMYKQQTAKVAKIFEKVGGVTLGGLEDGARSKLEFEKLQIFDISILFAVFIGACTTILAYDLQFVGPSEEDEVILLLFALIWLVFWSTVSANYKVVLVVFRYLQKLKYLKVRKLVSETDNLITSGQIWPLLGEIFLLLLQPYPFIIGIVIDDHHVAKPDIKFYYYINDIFSVLITVRIYIVGRVILNATNYRSPRARRLNSLYGAENNYLYAFKCLMKKCPFLCVTVLLGGSIFLFGYMLRICERPLNRGDDDAMNFQTYWNAMWCVILTMTTVGYGDYYPRTHFGRVVTFLCCIWGVFVVSLVVVTLNNTLTMTTAEEKSLNVLDRLEIRKEIRDQAVEVLSSVAKMGVNNRRFKALPRKMEAENNKLIRSIKKKLVGFKQSSRQLRELNNNGDVVDSLTRQFDIINERMDAMTAQQQQLFAAMQNLTEALETKKFESITKVPDYDSPIPRQLPQPKA